MSYMELSSKAGYQIEEAFFNMAIDINKRLLKEQEELMIANNKAK